MFIFSHNSVQFKTMPGGVREGRGEVFTDCLIFLDLPLQGLKAEFILLVGLP